MLKTPIRNKIVYIARNISAIDVMVVKKCRPWPDAASEKLRLVWVYAFCICPKVPFRMTLAICTCKCEWCYLLALQGVFCMVLFCFELAHLIYDTDPLGLKTNNEGPDQKPPDQRLHCFSKKTLYQDLSVI